MLKGFEEVYHYFEEELPDILRELPLKTTGKVGIYGTGIHTERLLCQYVQNIGEIKAELVFINSKKIPGVNKYLGYDVYAIDEIGSLNLDCIIISSSLYEKEMYEKIVELYGSRYKVYRFYENGRNDLFLYEGIYIENKVSEMPRLKINYVDFWDGFDKYHFKLTKILLRKYRLELSDEPQLLICSHFGDEHKRYSRCKKLFWETEPFPLDWDRYDFGIGYHYYDEKHNFLHFNPMKPRGDVIQQRERFQDESLAKRKFCNFIYANESFGEGALLRKQFCIELSKYKHIDCPGKVLNNMKNAIGDRYAKTMDADKCEFIKNYKFTIAFENNMIDGYTTEKLWQPLTVGSIPIYWGNPRIAEEVEKDAFINCNEFDNDLDAIIDRVKEIDKDDEYYMYMLSKSPLKPLYRDHTDDEIFFFLKEIIETQIFK